MESQVNCAKGPGRKQHARNGSWLDSALCAVYFLHLQILIAFYIMYICKTKNNSPTTFPKS